MRECFAPDHSFTFYSPGDSLKPEALAGDDGEVSGILVNGLDAVSDDIDFSTVSRSAELPESYKNFESQRFQ